MSNAYEVIKRVGRKCDNLLKESGKRSLAPTDEAARPKLPGGVPAYQRKTGASHRHADLTGGRAKQCQVYPKAFCVAVCEGVAAQKRLMKMGLKSEPIMSLSEMVDSVPESLRTGDPSRDLHEHEDEYQLDDGTVAFDDQSGAALKPALMKIARKEEMIYFRT